MTAERRRTGGDGVAGSTGVKQEAKEAATPKGRRKWSPDFVDFGNYVVFCFFLTLASIGYASSGPYYMRRNLENIFLRTEFASNVDYSGIGSYNDVQLWAENVLVANLFPQKSWNGADIKESSRFLSDGVSYRVGKARIRVVRAKVREHCDTFQKSVFKKSEYTCYRAYSCSDESDSDFVSGGLSVKYQTAKQTKEVNYESASTGLSYCGGGQVVELDETNALNQTRALFEEGWFFGHRDVRAAIVSFAVYSPHDDVYALVRIAIERLPGGGALVPTYEITSAPLFLQSRSVQNDGLKRSQALEAWFEFVFYGLCIVYLIREIRFALLRPAEYFESFWNWVELLNLSMYAAVALYRVQLIYWMITSAAKTLDDSDEFATELMAISHIFKLISSLNSVNMVLTCLKGFKYLRHIDSLAQFTETIAATSDDCATLGFIILVEFTGFAFAFFVGFGSSLEEYKRPAAAYSTLFGAFLGSHDFSSLVAFDPLLAVVLFLPFIVMNYFIILSMFLAYINFAFDDVRTKFLENKHKNQDSSLKPFAQDVAYCYFSITSLARRCLRLQDHINISRVHVVASADEELEQYENIRQRSSVIAIQHREQKREAAAGRTEDALAKIAARRELELAEIAREEDDARQRKYDAADQNGKNRIECEDAFTRFDDLIFDLKLDQVKLLQAIQPNKNVQRRPNPVSRGSSKLPTAYTSMKEAPLDDDEAKAPL